MNRAAFLLLWCASLEAAPYCDAPPEVQSELRRAAALWERLGPRKTFEADRKAILEALVVKHPEDIQANRRYQNDLDIPQSELIRHYKERLDAKPDSAINTYLYGLALVGRDTPEAILQFGKAMEKDRELAWVNRALAQIYSTGKLADRAKSREHLNAFFGLCPAILDTFALRMLALNGSPEVQASVARAVRERLAGLSASEQLDAYQALWNLEFKQRPPNEHAELRKRVAADLQRIRRLVTEPSLGILRLLRDGYRLTNDSARATEADDEILQRFANSNEAASITPGRWDKEYPFPKGDSEKEKHEYFSMRYVAAGQWIKRWPYDAQARSARFSSARGLKDLSAPDLKAAADQLLGFLANNPGLSAFPPFPNQVAEEYLIRGIYVDDVPALAEAGLKADREQRAKREPNDTDPPELTNLMARSLRTVELVALEQLAQSYARLKRPEKAHEIQVRLDRIDAPQDGDKATKLRVASRIAELSGRKADALAYAEKSIAMQPKTTYDWVIERQKELCADALRIWKDLGGSEETWQLRTEAKPEVKEAKTAEGWKSPEKVIPAFELLDLNGKPWATGHLAGKTVLINVWATWCDPCRRELPNFQKLHDKLKDRKDVVTVTFNVDEQVGLVQTFVEQNKFTFPVLLAGPFVNAVFTGGTSIPRNWILDANGIHRYEQIGFGESSDWEQHMVDMVERAKSEND